MPEQNHVGFEATAREATAMNMGMKFVSEGYHPCGKSTDIPAQ